MRRVGIYASVLVLAVMATACGGGGGGGEKDDPTLGGGAIGSTSAPVATSTPAASATATATATALTLRLKDVRLVNSEESDNGLRVLLPAGVTTASVTVTGLPTPNQVVSVCQARELDRRLPSPTCRTPTNGQAVSLDLGSAASGVEIIQIGALGGGAAGNQSAIDEIAIRYTAPSREISVRLPQIAAGDTGGTPTFSMAPAGPDGAYRATINWMVIPVFGGTPASVQLEFVQGTSVANQAGGGGGEVRLTGNAKTPVGDVAIRVRNDGGNSLVSPRMTLLLP